MAAASSASRLAIVSPPPALNQSNYAYARARPPKNTTHTRTTQHTTRTHNAHHNTYGFAAAGFPRAGTEGVRAGTEGTVREGVLAGGSALRAGTEGGSDPARAGIVGALVGVAGTREGTDGTVGGLVMEGGASVVEGPASPPSSRMGILLFLLPCV